MKQTPIVRLTPFSRPGDIVSRLRSDAPEIHPEFSFVCDDGEQYAIVTDDHWRRILFASMGQPVQLIGLLRSSDQTVIPQKVFPKGPFEKIAEHPTSGGWRNSILEIMARKLRNRVGDLSAVTGTPVVAAMQMPS